MGIIEVVVVEEEEVVELINMGSGGDSGVNGGSDGGDSQQISTASTVLSHIPYFQGGGSLENGEISFPEEAQVISPWSQPTMAEV